MENNRITLESIERDPDYNFLNKFNTEHDILVFDQNDLPDSPFKDLENSCNYYDENSLCSKFSTYDNFSAMSINIQSLPAKFNQFNLLINSLNQKKFFPSVICLQEIWQLPNDQVFSINGYHSPLFKCRNNNIQGGGVAIYINQEFSFTELPEYSIFFDRILESKFVKVSISPKKHFIIGSIYRPATNHPTLSSSEQYNQFIDLFSNLISQLSDSNCPIILLGDLNLDLLKYSQIRQVTDYADLLFSHGFLQMIMKPTRLTTNSATLIDHVVTNNPEIVDSAILISDLSDHFPVLCFMKTLSKNLPHSEIKFRNFSTENTEKFKAQLRNLNWEFLQTIQNTQEAYNHFSDTFFMLFDLFFPLKSKKINKNFDSINPWFTRGLIVSRSRKNFLHKNMLKNPSEQNILAYKQYRNVYNNTVRISKKNYFEQELLRNQSDSRKTWQTIRKAINLSKKKDSPISKIFVNGNFITDSKSIADEFNKFFLNVAPTISNDILPAEHPPPPEPEI